MSVGAILPHPFLESRQSSWLTADRECAEFAAPVFGIKAKPNPGTAKRSIQVCRTRFWNQGKAHERRLTVEMFAAPVFGIKAKHADTPPLPPSSLPRPFLESRQSQHWRPGCFGLVCRARFWNQGKAYRAGSSERWHFAAPVFGIKAKQGSLVRFNTNILPRPFLESRQSYSQHTFPWRIILPHPFLESRQSRKR